MALAGGLQPLLPGGAGLLQPVPALPGLQKDPVLLPLALQGLGLPLQLAQGGLQGLHALGELLGGGGPLLGEQGFLHGLEPAAVLLQGLGPLLELVLDVRPHLGGEQGAQHVALLLGAGPEQPEEVPLGQDDDLGELLAAQVEQLLRPAADGAFAAALQQDELPPVPGGSTGGCPGAGAAWCSG